MEQNTSPSERPRVPPPSARASSTPVAIEFSLTRGGPFYEWMRKFGLVRGEAADPLRQSLAIIALGWLPLEVFAFVDQAAAATPLFSFWRVLSIHVRFLVAVPLLFLAEQSIESRCRSAISSFSEGDFVRGAPNAVARAVQTAERMRSSFIAEIALLLIVVASRVVVWRYSGRLALVHDYDYPQYAGSTFGVSWYAFVSLPIFNFLLMRWLWRWLIWTQLLWNLSRLNLHLVPTHPDRAGGIALLAEPIYAMACSLAGVSSVLAASWGSGVYFAKADPATFAAEIAALLVIGELLALGPCLPFASQLLLARFEGARRYTGLGLAYTRLFERRWIDSHDRNGLLGTQDISALADIISSYQILEHMRIVPFARSQVLIVLIAMLAPLVPLPLLASKHSIDEVFRHLIDVLLVGG